MKKLLSLLFMASIALILAACGSEKVDEDTTYSHPFSEFNLEVDYTPTEKYDASFEKDVEGLEVSIEDQMNDEKLNGDDAFDKLNPLLESLTFTKDTEDQAVIDEVISVFGLDPAFAEFDLEVLFNDGTSKEYRLIK